MSNKKISELSAVDINTLNGSEPFPLEQGGVAVKMTLQQWITIIEGSLPTPSGDGVGLVNGIEIVNGSRAFQASDAGKYLLLASGVILTLPGSEIFPTGTVVGVVTNETDSGFEVNVSGKTIFPYGAAAAGGSGLQSELVLLSAVTGGGSTAFVTPNSLIIDTGDGNKIKTAIRYLMDNQGGGGSIESDTWSNWDAKRQAGTLPISKDIFVTDRPLMNDFSGVGLRLKTNHTGDGFELEGSGGFKVPDYNLQNLDISANPRYAGIEPITGVAVNSFWGQWNFNQFGAPVTGNVVVYDGYHWQLLDDTKITGDTPPLNKVKVDTDDSGVSGLNDITFNQTNTVVLTPVTYTIEVISNSAQLLSLNSLSDYNAQSISDNIVGDQNGSTGTIIGKETFNGQYFILVEVTGGNFVNETSFTNGSSYTSLGATPISAKDAFTWTDGTNNGFIVEGNYGGLDIAHGADINLPSATGHTIGDIWIFTVSPAYYKFTKDIEDVGYITDWDIVHYDSETSLLKLRVDKWGNFIRGNNNINSFQWGGLYSLNWIVESESSFINITNNAYYNSGHIIGDGNNCTVQGQTGSDVYIWIEGHNDTINVQNCSGQLQLHIYGFSSGISAIGTTGNHYLYLYNNSLATIDGSNGTIRGRYYDFCNWDHSNNQGNIGNTKWAKFERGSNGSLILDGGIFHDGNTYNNPNTFNFPSNKSYEKCDLGVHDSSFGAAVDITDIGIGSKTLDISSDDVNFCANFELDSSNSSEEIDTIVPTGKLSIIRLYPANNITALTITGTSNAPSGKISLPLSAGGSIVLDGSKGDYIELVVQVDGSIKYRNHANYV